MLAIITKTFSELTSLQLYAILQLRSEVFVVEQDCVYQDIDDKDQVTVHDNWIEKLLLHEVPRKSIHFCSYFLCLPFFLSVNHSNSSKNILTKTSPLKSEFKFTKKPMSKKRAYPVFTDL